MAAPTDRPIQASTIRRTLQLVAGPELLSQSWAQLDERRLLVTEAFTTFQQWHAALRPTMTTIESQTALDDYYHNVQGEFVDTRARINQRMRELEAPIPNRGQSASPMATGQDIDMSSGAVGGTRQNGPQEQPFDVRVLSVFTGEYRTWREFRALFTQHVAENTQMPERQKLRILLASLSGRALAYVQDGAEEQVYEHVWLRLINFYDNVHRQRMAYWHELATLPVPRYVHSKAIRLFAQQVQEILNMIRATFAGIFDSETSIIYLIEQRMDSETRALWHQWQAKHGPTLQQVFAFLEERVKQLDREAYAPPGASSAQRAVRNKPPRETESGASRKRKPIAAVIVNPPKRAAIQAQKNVYRRCAHCESTGDHFVQKCPRFASLAIPDRIARARALRLCQNCMRTDHDASVCNEGKCKRCNIKHNSLLCPHGKGKSDKPEALYREQQSTHESRKSSGSRPVDQSNSAVQDAERWTDLEQPSTSAGMRPVIGEPPRLAPPPAPLADWVAKAQTDAAMKPYLPSPTQKSPPKEQKMDLAKAIVEDWSKEGTSDSGSSSTSSSSGSEPEEHADPVEQQTKSARHAFKRQQQMRVKKSEVTLPSPRPPKVNAASEQKELEPEQAEMVQKPAGLSADAEASQSKATAEAGAKLVERSKSPEKAQTDSGTAPLYADVVSRALAGSILDIPTEPPMQLLVENASATERVRASLEDLRLQPEQEALAVQTPASPRSRRAKSGKKKTPKKGQ